MSLRTQKVRQLLVVLPLPEMPDFFISFMETSYGME